MYIYIHIYRFTYLYIHMHTFMSVYSILAPFDRLQALCARAALSVVLVPPLE